MIGRSVAIIAASLALYGCDDDSPPEGSTYHFHGKGHMNEAGVFVKEEA